MGRVLQVIALILFIPTIILVLAGLSPNSTQLPLIMGGVVFLICIALLYAGNRMVKAAQGK